MQKKNSFKLRAFVSLYMTLAFVIMTISGIILYIAPPGRIAHWTYWAMLGLTKSEWQAVHIMFTFIFVFAGVLHIIYNWKPLVKYFSNKMSGNVSIRNEFILSIIFSLVIFSGTYYHIPPFGTVIDFGEYITDSWSEEATEPPIPHAEELTISEIAVQLKMKTKGVMQKLNRSGYVTTDSTITLKDLAEKYDVVPSEIYSKISAGSSTNLNNSSSSSSGTYRQGSGYGRKQLSDILNENNITWEDGIERLKKVGIIVSEDGKLKDIASDNDKLPIDVINALQIGEH